MVEANISLQNRLIIESEMTRDYSTYDSCIILICLEGEGEIGFKGGMIEYKLGDSILIPYAVSKIELTSNFPSKFLEVRIP